MKKSILLFFTVACLIFNFGLTNELKAQTATTTINYTGFLACGGCVVCGGDYYCFNTLSSYCGNTAACNTSNFINPVPAGNIVTGVNVAYFSAGCNGGSLSANINGQAVPAVNEGSSGCLCSAAPCVQSASSSSVFPCGLPGYNNSAGGVNSLQLCTGADVCINRLVITLTYAPANQASPATQPTSILGATNVCPGAAQTFSCPAVANASSYNWTFPAGWTINSGAGTNVVTATPGSAGNICVRAQNLCGNSPYTCISVGLLTASTPPAGASASPNPVCASASTTTLNISGGSLGTAASWNWYSGSCGGTFVGSGSSITVSPSSTTTYFVSASGTCNTTACASVVFTVNPAPTANAGAPAALNCSVTNAILSGSGGGTYSWSGPGIVSGATSANPTVNLPGTYSLIVTSAGCPSAVSTVLVTQDITPPTVTASNTGSLNCSTTTVALNATGGGSYSWSGTGIVSGGTTPNPIVNSTGPYVVTVTSSNGCTATANTSVAQDITPPSVTASNTGSLNCSTTTVALNATGGGTYSWSGTGIVSGGNTANPIVNGTGPYVVTVTGSNGCSATANTSVAQDITPPTVTASNTGSLNCSTTSVALNATGGGTYSWSGTGIISGGTTANPIVNGTGPYVVTVTGSNGCTATANTSVPQNNTPPLAAANNSGSLTCTTTTITLTGTGGGTYIWSGPGIVSGGSTANPLVNLVGSYDVTVTAANGCTATANTTVGQNLVFPSITMPSTQTITCLSPSVSLIGSSNPSNCTPLWTGGVCAGANSFTASACSPNTYSLTVTDPSNGCSTTGTVDVVPSLGIPIVSASNSGSITCTTNTAQVSASTTMTPVTYAWSGPGAVIGATTPSGTVSIGGTYQCVVTNTLSGCSSTVTTVVSTNTTPVSANIVTPSLITCTDYTITLNATPTGSNYSYSWSGPGTIINGTTDNPTVDAAGNYIVTITDNTNGCVGNFTTTVSSNTTTPTFTLGSASSVTTTCASPNATLSATSSSDPNTIYTWTTPSSTTITGTPIFVSTTGIYTVIVTNTANGCSSSSASSQATVEVIADSGIPVVNLSAISLSITCSNPTPSVVATTTSNPVSYNWTPTTGIVSGTETTANPSFNAAGSYSVVVTNTTSGCASSINANVVDVILDNAEPVILLSSAANTETITCANPQVIITPTVTSSTGLANLTYTWLPSGVTSSSLSNATFTAQGIYTLVVTNTLTGCVSSSTNTANTFTVYPNLSSPTGSITAISTNSTIGCGASNSTVTLSASSTPTNALLTWLPSNTNGTMPLDVIVAGNYSLVTTDPSSGCSDTTEYIVSGDTNPPQGVDAGSFASIACGDTTTILNGTSTSTNVSYSWNGPSSTSIISNGTTLNPTVGEIGMYVLTVTDNSTNCFSTSTVIVTQAIATASITANPTSGISPLDVSFIGTGLGSPSFNWNFGDGNTSVNQNPNNVFTTGTYTVILTTTSGSCVATATVQIVVEDGLTLEIPNVFTPNDDKSNDIFTIKSTGIKEISLQIYSRWGQKLYEFSGPKASWDGLTPSGTIVPEGTYFYFVKATGFDGQEIEKHGSVNLFR